ALKARKRRPRSCDDSTRLCDSQPDGIFGKDNVSPSLAPSCERTAAYPFPCFLPRHRYLTDSVLKPSSLCLPKTKLRRIQPSREQRYGSICKRTDSHGAPGGLARPPLRLQSRPNFATRLNDVECHVWTAHAVQERNLTFPRSFGCSHAFGLLMQPFGLRAVM